MIDRSVLAERLRLGLLGASALLVLVMIFPLLRSPGSRPASAQISPITPLETPSPPEQTQPTDTQTSQPSDTSTPVPTATLTPVTPTPVSPQVPAGTPGLPAGTAFPAPTPPLESRTPSSEPITGTLPLSNLLVLPPVDRPLAFSTPGPGVDPLVVVERVFLAVGSAAAWLWLVCGSLVFFAVAGIVAGLIFSQRERDRFELYRVQPPQETPSARTQGPSHESDKDDIWPASLP